MTLFALCVPWMQRDVFEECAVPLLEAALGGQDSCLFAYGQTGTGKT